MATTNYILDTDFDLYDNKYAIIYNIYKNKYIYKIIYGHFYNNDNMFEYKKVLSENIFQKNFITGGCFRTTTDNIVKNEYNNECYLFSTYSHTYKLLNILKENSTELPTETPTQIPSEAPTETPTPTENPTQLPDLTGLIVLDCEFTTVHSYTVTTIMYNDIHEEPCLYCEFTTTYDNETASLFNKLLQIHGILGLEYTTTEDNQQIILFNYKL